MQFQVSTKYAIRILQYLHLHSKELSSASTISNSIGVAYPFVNKIAGSLKRHGLLTTVQGRHGGYKLARPAVEISVYDIFLAIEGELQIVSCLKNEQCCNQGTADKCAAHDYLLTLQDDVVALLSRKYVADLSQ